MIVRVGLGLRLGLKLGWQLRLGFGLGVKTLEMADPGNSGPWNWRTLEMADPGIGGPEPLRHSVSSSRRSNRVGVEI